MFQNSFFKRIIFLFILINFSDKIASQLDVVLAEKLDKKLDSMLVVFGGKSLSASIQFPNNQVWSKAVGFSSAIEKVDKDYLYLIGSCMKTITSATILKLVDEGEIMLDDKIIKYVPVINYIDTNITIRMLLNHRSGIYDILENQSLNTRMIQNQGQILYPGDMIPQYIKPAIFPPNNKWAYSNTNYFLLGMILERVTGLPWYEVIKNKFYDPLGLSSFTIPAFDGISGNVAHPWMDITGDNVVDDAHNFYMGYKALNSMAGAAGGYFATSADLAKWMRIYMRGDLISSTLMDEARITSTGTGLPNGISYGLGLMKTKIQGIDAYGHGGDLVYSASSWYIPDLDISIAILNNDGRKNSWTLLPTVNALIKAVKDHKLTNVKEEDDKKYSYDVYPNPFFNELSIDLSNISNSVKGWKICNTLGKVVLSGGYEEHCRAIYPEMCRLDLSELNSGTYFLQIETNDLSIKTKKIIKL